MTRAARAEAPLTRFAYSRFEIKAAGQDGEIGFLEGIASTPAPDRMGDIVEPGGAVFKLPIPLLWQHDARQPIGKVVAAKVTPDGIEIRAEIHKLTGSIQAQFNMIKAGLVAGLSIGFRELEGVPLDPKAPWDGWRFTSWEWLELSAVTIPANAEATISAIKHFDAIGRASASADEPEPAAEPAPTPPAKLLAPAKRTPPAVERKSGAKPMGKFAARIETLERETASHQGAIDEIMQLCTAENRDPDETENDTIDVARGLMEAAERNLSTYKNLEQDLAKRAANGNAKPAGSPAILSFHSKTRRPGEIMVKAAMAQLFAHVDRTLSADAHADRLFRNDNEAVTAVKSIVNPAMTTVAGWAQELVREDVQGFLDLLKPNTLWRQLDARSPDLNFGSAHSIKVPGRSATPTIPGGFIGEGGMIPVKRLGFIAQSIFRYKMAVISTFSREMLEQSTPNIESILRQAMADDTSVSIDANLLSSSPAVPGIKPPGLFVGMTTTASSGNTLANIVADVRLMVSHVTTALARDPVWIMNPQRLIGLSLITNATGQFLFKDEIAAGTFMGYPVLSTTTVPPTIIALIDAADFRSAFDAPAYLVSDHATLVEVDADDGTPPYIQEDDVPPAGAITSVGDAITSTPPGPVRSLYQTDTLALRMIMPLSWHQFRAVNSYVLTAVGW